MKYFGKDEMEILNADGHPSDIRDFLVDMATYVLENDIGLQAGETIGFSEDDIHSLVKPTGLKKCKFGAKGQKNRFKY